MVQPIPTGYTGVTPYLIIRGATRALDFYKKAFGAVELMRFPGPDGTIGHAEMKIGEGVVMLENALARRRRTDRKSTRLNSSHVASSYAVFCLKKKKKK